MLLSPQDATELAGTFNTLYGAPFKRVAQVPLWAQMLSAVKNCFFIVDPEPITLDEREVAVSALQNTICPSDDQTIGMMLKGDPVGTQLKIGDFDLGLSLGQGGFGKVILARHVKSGFIVALKRLKIPREDCWEHLSLNRESQLPTDLVHDHVLKHYGKFQDDDFVYLVLEHAPGGSFREVLKHKPLSKAMAAKYISDLSKALKFCHEQNIIHRDIKPDNLLLGFDGKIKIADFGSAAYCRKGKDRQTQVGTPTYWAPEIVQADNHDERVDIWSLGICLFEFIVGKPPTFKGTEVKWPDNLDDDAKDLISKMLKREPQERIPLVEIVKHPFVTRAL